KGLPLLTYLDIVAPPLILAQAIGRWGNFFNEEAFGRPTDLPWKLYISEPRRPPAFVDQQFFHPTFLYESLWNAVCFLLLYFALRRRLERAPGALFLAYLGVYSLGRFFVEGLRTDSLMLGSLRVAQLVRGGRDVGPGVGLPPRRRPPPPGGAPRAPGGRRRPVRGSGGGRPAARRPGPRPRGFGRPPRRAGLSFACLGSSGAVPSATRDTT